ncbi:MAG: hypothetical protein ACC661_09885, partial [Verrucomicrobiales bacterium]
TLKLPGEDLEIERIARELGIPIFRLAPYFQADFEKKQRGPAAAVGDPKSLYVGSGIMHVNPLGAAVAAEAIAAWLEQHPELLD